MAFLDHHLSFDHLLLFCQGHCHICTCIWSVYLVFMNLHAFSSSTFHTHNAFFCFLKKLRKLNFKNDANDIVHVLNSIKVQLHTVYRVIFAPCYFHPSKLANRFVPSWIRPDPVVLKEVLFARMEFAQS